jgi:sulfofructose kinase
LVATAMVACARLGAECAFYSILGDDAVGDEIMEGLEAEDLPTGGIVRCKGGESPISFVHVDADTGERTIFHRSGTSLQWRPEEFDFAAIKTSGVLLIDDIYPTLSLIAARQANEAAVPVVADLIPDSANEYLLQHIDALVAPRHYAKRLGLDHDIDAALDEIHKLGPTTAVITLGAEGWAYSDGSGRGRGKAFDLEVVDTTGAGDTFHGAFAYGVASGWDTPTSCEFAGAVASIKCASPGGRAGIPSLDQTMAFLKARSERDWDAVA